MTADARSRRWAAGVYPIFFLSGIAGLGYEIVWAKMFAVGLGHEMPSLLAVVAAFFGGLALGAWALDGVVSRSRTPGRWYAACELVIGGWALLSIALIPLLNRLAASWIGIDPSPLRHWLVAFGVPFLGLLPATAAMGATLPAMDRLVARLRGSGSVVSGLYAVNTAGAMAGTLLTTFLIMPALGHRAALVILAVGNAICAVSIASGAAAGESKRTDTVHAFDDPPRPWRLGVTIFMTGLLGIGYEVLGVRVMAQVLENTVYSFASALSIFLLGTAVGAALYQRFARKRSFAVPLLWLLQATCVACLFGVLVLGESSAVYETVRAKLGGGPAASIAGEMWLAAAVFLVPSLLMGAMFSHLVQAARSTRGGVGRALGLNTIGSSCAPLLFGIVLLPALGSKWALLAVAAGYLLLVPWASITVPRLLPLGAAVALVVFMPGSLVLVEAPPGAKIIDYREGVMAATAVTEDPEGNRRLKVSNRFYMGGTARSFADRRQAHIPIMLHPAPESALFLGLGTGMTVGAAAEHPGLAITAVELVPEVIEMLDRFSPENNFATGQAVTTYVAADARRFVRAADEQFDVIVADLFHPGRDGAGALYTAEHFAAVRGRLADGGLFCQWLPLYQLEVETARLIVRTFLSVFPETFAVLAHFNIDTPMLGLIARPAGATYDGDIFRDRVPPASPLSAALDEIALGDAVDLLGCLIAGPDALQAFAGPGPLNTDDHPRVVYEAPLFTYAGREGGDLRIEPVLAAMELSAADILATDDAFATRLDDYLAARDLYLEAQFRRHDGAANEVADLLVASAARSRDFKTAYVVGLSYANDLARSDMQAARDLLVRLHETDPTDGRAGQLLRSLR